MEPFPRHGRPRHDHRCHSHIRRRRNSAPAGPGTTGQYASKTGARGSVTAELAVVLPAMTALLAMLLLSVSVGMLQLRLEEGARAGARALARGDSTAVVVDLVARLAGEQVTVSVSNSESYATVTVQGRAGGVLSGLLPWTQSARASARVESAAPRVVVERQGVSALRWGNGARPQKLSLWRWARGPDCQFFPPVCETALVAYPSGKVRRFW